MELLRALMKHLPKQATQIRQIRQISRIVNPKPARIINPKPARIINPIQSHRLLLVRE
jgi:hypothetical protein